MRAKWISVFGFLALFLALGGAFFVLPLRNPQAYLSPDETAVAVMARQYADSGWLRAYNPVLGYFPWMHPRSLVTVQGVMVPVGFLGMPMLLGLIVRGFGQWGMNLFTPLLALSVIYPIWRWGKRFGRAGQLGMVATWLTFPTVILYANRGLFPNLPVVAFGVWAAYLLQRDRCVTRVLAGVVLGLAVAIRPTEAIWLVPWMGLAWWEREKKSKPWRLAGFIVPVLVVCAFAANAASWTYGSAWAIGYSMRDPIVGQVVTAHTPAQTLTLPFGFHPRAMLKNVVVYFGSYLWPWVLVAIFGTWFVRKNPEGRRIIWLGAWTLGSLLLLYGQAVYQDRVGGGASTGNSFLRYLLPLAPFFVLATGAVVQRLQSSKRGLAVALLVAILCGYGVWTAFRRDDENVARAVTEVARYEAIRSALEEKLPEGAVVLSERSDKIFFPLWQAVSPMPDDERIKKLLEAQTNLYYVYYFGTTLDRAGLEAWTSRGFNLRKVLEVDNQSLYEILP